MKSALLLPLVMNISLASATEITKGENHQLLNIETTSITKSTKDSASTTIETYSPSSEKSEPFRKMNFMREVFREANFHR